MDSFATLLGVLPVLIEEQTEAGGHTTILLVEEDPRSAMLIAEMLKAGWGEGLLITQAERLGDALEYLLDGGAPCVLLGLPAGAADILEPLARLRAAAPDAAIVVLTAEPDDARAVQAVRAGAQDVLVKSELSPARLGRCLRLAVERKRTEVQLAHLALHDPLTGLPNRALFLDRLSVALDRSRRTNGRVAVLFVDVDEFKDVNDSLGHAAGDRVLTVLADRLRGMLRPMDTVARFGGDEFTLLFEDLDNEREVVLIAERITRAAKLPVSLDDGEAVVTVSIGIATVTDPTMPPEMVIREADTAMYRAKDLGRSRYELFDESSRQRTMQRLELEAALSHALERSELRVFYQPKIELETPRRLTGFEALIRWEHPELGMIPPAEFLPLAEETGLVLRIGEFVLADALRHLAIWRQQNAELTVSVNLSPRQLADAGLASLLAAAIHSADVDPAALCLEVSDESVTHNPETSITALRALKATGVKISLDDYGTGSTSLASLRQMPVDELKIHESFVTDLGSGEGASVVAAVVRLAHALGMHVVAEGVETDAQLDELRAIGCDGAQGFLFGAPVPGESAQAMLAG